MMLSAVSFAQKDSLRAVVNIESDYTPVTMSVNKINFSPDVIGNAARKPPAIFFSEASMPFDGFVSEKSTRELTHQATLPYEGYARLGYGVVNELDVKASYNFDITPRDNVNAYVAVDGYKRWLDGEIDDWKSRMYNTTIGMNYSHRFDYLKLDVDAGVDNMVFNYQDAGFNAGHTDKQNSTGARVGVRGESMLSGPFAYTFRAGYTYAGRKYSYDMEKGINENRILAGGSVLYKIENAELNEVGMDLELNTFLYNGVLRKSVNKYRDYLSLDIDPYLNFNISDWQLRLGTSMKIVTANGATFSIAPDVRLRKDFSDKIQFFAYATGGREDNSFARIQSITPYWGFDEECGKQLKPTYKVVDATVGSTITVEPLFIEMTAGYAYTKDDLLQTMEVSGNSYIYSNLAQQNTHNAHLFARLGYDLGGWLNVSGDARYDYWDCDNEDLLVLKPEITCNLNAEARIFGDLTINAGYNFTRYTKSAKGKRVGLKNDLNLRIAYQITPRFGAYIQGDNLLNDKHYEYAGYYARGARGLIGLTANF